MEERRATGGIVVDRLSRHFGPLRALDELTLGIAAGEWVAVTGPSGSGKTTLLNLLAGLDRPSSGRLAVAGVEVGELGARELARYRRQTVGLIFQRFHLVPYLTALENVMLAQYVHSLADQGEAQAALEAVGLGARVGHLPSQLSGGEQQRVCIARALVNHPPVILADEPTGNLDGVNEALVMNLLAELHGHGHTLVLVTHDPAIAARADREVRLEHGRLAPIDEAVAEDVDFLADLWRALAEDGEAVSVSRRGVAEALARGSLRFAAEGLELTPAGRLEAAVAARRLRLAEALLAHALQRSEPDLCGRVAPVAASVVDEVCAFLAHPARCPHGRAIPPGSCPVCVARESAEIAVAG